MGKKKGNKAKSPKREASLTASSTTAAIDAGGVSGADSLHGETLRMIKVHNFYSWLLVGGFVVVTSMVLGVCCPALADSVCFAVHSQGNFEWFMYSIMVLREYMAVYTSSCFRWIWCVHGAPGTFALVCIRVH